MGCKKVENVFFCKKVDLSSTQGAYVQYQLFFYFTYLRGGA